MSAGRALTFLFVIALAGAGAGLLYNALTRSPSPFGGMIYGACIGTCISSFERGFLFPDLQSRMRRWPTPLFIPAMEAATVLWAVLGYALGGLINWSVGLVPGTLTGAVVPSAMTLVYSLLIAAVLVTLTRVRDLLGHEVFVSLLIGRYHRPVEERRIFLFLDVVGSTDFARRHGDLRAQAYLGAIFAAIAEPVLAHKGAIDDYVGDMVMISWPEARGLAAARCVACVFAILDRIETGREQWLGRFGQVPRFHAALHGGAIVTAEVGVDRHKISYFGDVVNTTARIEALCRNLAAPILISADLIGRLPDLPRGVRAFARGDHPIKGHDQRLSVLSLEQSDGAAVYPLARLTKGESAAHLQHRGVDSAP
jgi:adenylate cyclase